MACTGESVQKRNHLIRLSSTQVNSTQHISEPQMNSFQEGKVSCRHIVESMKPLLALAATTTNVEELNPPTTPPEVDSEKEESIKQRMD